MIEAVHAWERFPGELLFFFFGLNKKLRCQVDESNDKEKSLACMSLLYSGDVSERNGRTHQSEYC